jgi:hypothetical protein
VGGVVGADQHRVVGRCVEWEGPDEAGVPHRFESLDGDARCVQRVSSLRPAKSTIRPDHSARASRVRFEAAVTSPPPAQSIVGADRRPVELVRVVVGRLRRSRRLVTLDPGLTHADRVEDQVAVDLVEVATGHLLHPRYGSIVAA